MQLFGEFGSSHARICWWNRLAREAKVSAVTGSETDRDDVPVADALPGRPDAAGGASPDSEDADRRQPRRAHLRQ